MASRRNVSSALLGLGVLISVVGALLGWFLYAVSAGGDCNPCGSPPLWIWSALLAGVVLIAAAVVLRISTPKPSAQG